MNLHGFTRIGLTSATCLLLLATPIVSPASAETTPVMAIEQTDDFTVRHPVMNIQAVYFEADAKYTRLVCRDYEAPVRLSIRDLVSRLDADQFWQIHRSYVVNVAEIDVVLRRLGGAMQIQLRSRPEKLPVSQAYQRRFKVD